MKKASAELIAANFEAGLDYCEKHNSFFPRPKEEDDVVRSKFRPLLPDCPVCIGRAGELLSRATSPAEKDQHARIKESQEIFRKLRSRTAGAK